MSDTVYLFLRIDINIIMLVLLIVVYITAVWRFDKSLALNRTFLNITRLLLVQLLVETATCVINKAPFLWLIPVTKALHVVIFIIGPLIGYLWYAFVRLWVNEKNLSMPQKQTLRVPFYLNLVITVLTPWLGLVFTISPENVYIRGPLFWVPVLTAYFYLLISFLLVMKRRKTFFREEYMILILFGILPATGGLIQALIYGILLMWSCTGVSLVTVFVLMQQRQMQYDALTGAWNKGAFDDFVRQKLKKRNKRYEWGVIFLDMDGLKQINDRYGHMEGDVALKRMADVLKQSLRRTDIVARFGGDEFVVLIQNLQKQTILEIIAVVEQNLAMDNEKQNKPYQVEFSCGYETFRSDKQSMDEFIQYVDQLMYMNKEQRKRNR